MNQNPSSFLSTSGCLKYKEVACPILDKVLEKTSEEHRTSVLRIISSHNELLKNWLQGPTCIWNRIYRSVLIVFYRTTSTISWVQHADLSCLWPRYAWVRPFLPKVPREGSTFPRLCSPRPFSWDVSIIVGPSHDKFMRGLNLKDHNWDHPGTTQEQTTQRKFLKFQPCRQDHLLAHTHHFSPQPMLL